MWSYRSGALALVVVLLAGCGFQPVYATRQVDQTGQAANAFETFRGVHIENIKDREGQFLRNQLTRLLQPSGRGSVTTHKLSVTLKESTRGLAVAKSAVASRANLRVTLSFKLSPIDEAGDEDGTFSGSVTATSGYNIFNSEFQTLAAEKGARERAITDAAEQVRLRLAALLTAPSSEETTR